MRPALRPARAMSWPTQNGSAGTGRAFPGGRSRRRAMRRRIGPGAPPSLRVLHASPSASSSRSRRMNRPGFHRPENGVPSSSRTASDGRGAGSRSRRGGGGAGGAQAQVGVVRVEAAVALHEAHAAGAVVVDLVEQGPGGGDQGGRRLDVALVGRGAGAAGPLVQHLEGDVLEDARVRDALDEPARPVDALLHDGADAGLHQLVHVLVALGGGGDHARPAPSRSARSAA